LGVVRKMQGRRAEAQAHFEEAIVHDTGKEVRKEAEIHLKRLRSPGEAKASPPTRA
jgi:hypothetical protein